jgi:hypothetical protein
MKFTIELDENQKSELLEMLFVAMDTKYDKAKYRMLVNNILDQLAKHQPMED